MKKVLYVLIAATLVMLISGCAQSIEDVKSEENVGEKVTVSGTVEESIKIGDFSGYVLKDENNDTLIVVSDSIPGEGDEVRVSGTLKEAPVLGYYIEAEE